MRERGAPGSCARGVVVVGDGPYDLAPIDGVPAVVRAARLVVELVGNVTLCGPPIVREQAVRLCAGLPTGDGPLETGIVLMHQAARPLAPTRLGRAVLDAVLDAVQAGSSTAAVPVLAVTDTVKQVGPDGTLRGAADRSVLRVVQAPFAFRPARLPGAPRDAVDLVRLCAAAGETVLAVPGDPAAAPLRTAWDLQQALAR